MNYSSSNINLFWGHLIVEELVRNGITLFCISPGSRSTPLTTAAAVHEATQVKICLDERGAAFFALGYARGNNKPAVLICTSGTAAANYFPAVIEAHQANIPLIILTADRPPELRETAANQTIDQVKMYGSYVNWFFDFPCPDAKINPAFVLSTIDQAVYRAISVPAGPVHVNCMFREPLAPEPQPIKPDMYSKISAWQKKSKSYTSYLISTPTVHTKSLGALTKKIKSINKGLILAGQMRFKNQTKYIIRLAEYLDWPVFAGVLSGFNRNFKHHHVINYFDNLLLNKKFRALSQPEMIIQFGRPLTSKRVLQYTENLKPSSYIVIEENAERLDPGHLVTNRLICPPRQVVEAVISRENVRTDSDRLNILKKFDSAVHTVITSFSKNDLSEINIAHLISNHIPAQTGLFLGSSLPIRDMDMYGSFKHENIRIEANRGASGIDGTIASAAGFAESIKKPVTLIVGDLTALHDLNSLRLISTSDYPVIIVLINNDGGGIFSFLPVAQYTDVFEEYFATPHGLNFKSASELFGLQYYSPNRPDDFTGIYQNLLKEKKSAILEIKSDKQNNFRLHQKLQKKISLITI